MPDFYQPTGCLQDGRSRVVPNGLLAGGGFDGEIGSPIALVVPLQDVWIVGS